MTTNNFEPCMCGHQRESHDQFGCVMCDAEGKRCEGYFPKSAHDDARDSALVEILKAQNERAKK